MRLGSIGTPGMGVYWWGAVIAKFDNRHGLNHAKAVFGEKVSGTNGTADCPVRS